MKHLKTILLALALLFSAEGLTAQERYDYAGVIYYSSSNEIAISINGETFEKRKADKDTGPKDILNMNPAFKEVKKLEEAGWELFDTETGSTPSLSYVFYLRKKIL